MVVATNSNAQIVHRYEESCCSSTDAPSEARRETRILSALLTRDSFPKASQIHRAEGAVVEPVSGLPGFAPDHPTVIGADGSSESGLMEGREDSSHVDVALIGWMRTLLEGVRAESLDVAAVGEVDASASSDAADDLDQVIAGGGGE